MGPVSAEVEIDVPREEIFAFLGDFANRPSFTDHFISGFHLSRIETEGVGAGARFRMNVSRGPIWVDTIVTAVEPPHRITEHGRGGRVQRVPTTTIWELTEGPGSLCTTRVTFWTEPTHPVDRIKEALGMSGSIERGLKTALRRLRDMLESGDRVSGRVHVAGGNRHATGVP